MLIWLYILLFALQVLLLVRYVRRGTRGGWLAVLEICSAVLAGVLMWYYDTLPGFGFMPGWSYFSEVFYSLFALVVYALMMLITVPVVLIRKFKK